MKIMIHINSMMREVAHYLIELIVERLPALIHREKGGAYNYLLALLLITIALAVRLVMAPVNVGLQYVTFFPAVTLAAVIGGLWPGIFATVLGLILATFIFTSPYYSISFNALQNGFWSNLVFLMDGIIVCSSIEAMHRYRQRLSTELEHTKQIYEKLKASEELLRMSGNEFKTILETTADGFWIISLENARLLEVNAAYCAMTGYSREELLQMTISDLEANENAEQVSLNVQAIIENRESYFESRHRHRDGHTLDVEISAKYMRSHGGCLVVFIRDITQRKLAAALLVQNEERLALATRAGVIGIWDWDISNNALIWDEAMYRLYGIHAEDTHSTYEAWLNAVHPEDRAYAQAEIRAALSGEREYAPEFRVIWPDGTLHYLKSASHTQFDASGNPLRMIGINYDLTPEKLVEQALLSAKIEADKANLAKSNFLSNMSHEIRTPMNAIIGLSDLALRQELSSRLRDYLSKIHCSSIVLLNILNDILDFSKIEAGHLELDIHEFNLENILKDIYNLFIVKAEEKKIELNLYISPDVPLKLLGDDLRLSQTLSNLVGNAVKFTDVGRIDMSVELLVLDSGYATLAFSVSDTGIGISSEQLSHLFQPFTQADRSISRRFGGTGLGLTISKQLVEKMGSEIVVESILGGGSRFSFKLRLPVAELSFPDSSVKAPERVAAIRGARALLVEDDPINLMVAREMLEDAGLTVISAIHGQQALDILQCEHFDVVLMDMQMPVMDGLTTTRAIRKNPGFSNLPIIAMTASAMAHDRDACLAAGMNDVVTKPILTGELMTSLARWVSPPQRESMPPAPSFQAPTVPKLPAELPGFRMDRLLAMGGTNHAPIIRLLLKFGEIYAGCENEINLLLASDQHDETCAYLHKLRGAAGTIGAMELTQAALALEQEIKAGNTTPSHELFIENLKRVLASLALLPDDTPPEKAASESDSCPQSEMTDLFRQLGVLLENNQFIPHELIDELKDKMKGHDINTDLRQLIKQIDIYNYPAALDILNVIRSTRGQ